ncbi:hypothetical protein BC834DRAFT_973141 [Gloeopeniophorella convolvens]|nr:hypothetical protein BC834DRAFT_973141 [Gloeopeniophorella convolvens]
MALFDTRRLRSGRLVRTFAPDLLVAALHFARVTLVIWGEIGVFFYARSGCRWPTPAFATSSQDTTRILIIADAQMVFFLGDTLTHSRAIELDEAFAHYVQHFHTFFPLDAGLKVRYVPGTTDPRCVECVTKHVRQRFEHYFGRVNQHLSVANHSLVLLDAPGIVDEDSTGWEFVKGLAADEPHDPVMLFSYIPLHGAESKTCSGSRRRSSCLRTYAPRGLQMTETTATSHTLPGPEGPGLHLLAPSAGSSRVHVPCTLSRTFRTAVRPRGVRDGPHAAPRAHVPRGHRGAPGPRDRVAAALTHKPRRAARFHHAIAVVRLVDLLVLVRIVNTPPRRDAHIVGPGRDTSCGLLWVAAQAQVAYDSRSVGHGWQMTLGKQASRFPLRILGPAAPPPPPDVRRVRSADDNDDCDGTHTFPR